MPPQSVPRVRTTSQRSWLTVYTCFSTTHLYNLNTGKLETSPRSPFLSRESGLEGLLTFGAKEFNIKMSKTKYYSWISSLPHTSTKAEVHKNKFLVVPNKGSSIKEINFLIWNYANSSTLNHDNHFRKVCFIKCLILSSKCHKKFKI